MGVKAGEGEEGEEEEGRRKRKSSLFKSKLQGGVRGEAVILRRVGKWRVRASRGCRGARRDYQCRRTASLPYTCRPSHNETAEVFPIIALTLWCIHLIDVNNKRIRGWDDPRQQRVIFVCFKQQTWTKGSLHSCAFWEWKVLMWHSWFNVSII